MPLSFDMPFEELSAYAGTNPRPEDFDSYWDRALAELGEVDPQVSMRAADFQAEGAQCFDLFFTGVGGARIYSKLLMPRDTGRPGPAVLMFHGYSGNSGSWVDKLSYVAQGFTVAAMDVRGQGGRSEDPGGVTGNTLSGHIVRGLEGDPDHLFFRSIFLDTAQLAGIVMAMPQVDPERVGATGYSQGGGLTLACAALAPGIRRAAPVYPFLSDYRRVWQIELDVDAYEELRTWFRWYDPLHRREQEVFRKLGYIDVQHLAPRIRAEVMMGVGLMDTICPPSTQFAAYNRIPGPKLLEIYPDFGHEHLPGLDDRIFGFLAGM